MHYKLLKNQFGHLEQCTIALQVDNVRIITSMTGNILIAEFIMEENKTAVFGMAHNKSPGPDGFTAEF